jgi:trehalose synthase
MNNYDIANYDTDRLAATIGSQRAAAFGARLRRLARALAGRRLINVTGDDRRKGGVYELMRAGLPYLRGAGVDVRWVDVTTRPEARPALEFFHVLAHGQAPSPEWQTDLTQRAAEFARFGRDAADELKQMLDPSDLLVLHDTQTAPVVAGLHAWAAGLVWMAQIGTADRNDRVDRYWETVAPSVARAGVCVFYTPDFVPASLLAQSVFATPSVDPSTCKSALMSTADARAVLTEPSAGWPLGWVSDAAPQLDASDVVAVQLSRWDPLKDMTGAFRVMRDVAETNPTFQGIVVGPSAQSESERRELAICVGEMEQTAPAVLSRLHVGVIGNCGSAEHDLCVRVLQSVADIIVQKSVQEGFGLTVTEAMLRGKPVLASAVGGITLQVRNGHNGLLISPGTDDAGWADSLRGLVSDEPTRSRLGTQGRTDVLDHHTIDRQLTALMDGIESKLLQRSPID